jgi:prolyl-tRNA synthetase
MLRMSRLFLRTLRDDPADAEVPSHRLLVRAGYVRRVGAGIYSWLPLGKIMMENVTRIVREEMDAMGSQEVLFPGLLPREFYEMSGRWAEYGDNLFRLKDRKGGDYLLGPTHEEMFTNMVKAEYSSYKDLPVMLYQIQIKYRDEARPRSGILRGREFIMKDSYSFDIDDNGLQVSYDLHRDAYIRTFGRLGMTFKIVSAMSGAMGGSKSEEFLAPSPIGDDRYVACPSCDYAANVEAVRVAPPAAVDTSIDQPAMRVLHTPNSPGIAALVEHMNTHEGMSIDASSLLKNILFKLDGTPICVLVPGDREVDEDRLAVAVKPGKLEAFEEADFAGRPDLVKGYVGAAGMAARGVTVYADPRIALGTSWVTGANKYEHHAADAVVGRDFAVDHYVEVATVAAGDPCPNCHSPLEIDRAIEIGHIFQLGRKYSDAFGLDVLGPDGKPVRVTMGSYGIGVTRAIAVIAEQTHDSLGLCWPRSVAPADVHLVAVAAKGAPIDVMAAADDLARELESLGLKVLFDDRVGVSPGVKFKDAELIGVPTIVIVGKGLVDGRIELKDRRSGERTDLAFEGAAAAIAIVVRSDA